MTQCRRLARGGRIDRGRPVTFAVNGRRYEGYAGDTLASALLANGQMLVARSIKYHRPRGIVAAGAEEPNAVLQVDQGPDTLPDQKATQVELYQGLTARSVNGWPSVRFDLLALNDRVIGGLLPAGFYYKTFMQPARLWRFYERFIRRAAGLGYAPEAPDPDRYDHMNAHCDVLVVGGGPAGLAAALAAGRTGARVLLADEQSEPGGGLLASRAAIDGRPAMEWVAATVAELRSMAEMRLLTRATVCGYYDHNFLTILERRTDHLPPAERRQRGARQRLWRVRARQVVLASGAIEQPLVFGNNDRPGIMLASAVSTYLIRYAVAPGARAMVFTNNNSAYRTALDLVDVGVSVAALVDARAGSQGALAAQARRHGIRILTGAVVVEALGAGRLSGVRVRALEDGTPSGRAERIDADLLAVSGGWAPAIHLLAQSGGGLQWDPERACFVPRTAAQPCRWAGAAGGSFQLGAALAEGLAAGAAAARDAGFGDGRMSATPHAEDAGSGALQPLWPVPMSGPPERGPRQFVDLQNDTTAADILLAAREGYTGIEHTKRYTLLGYGTDQGKLGNIGGMAILANTLRQDMSTTGTTTFRPPYTPMTFGAVAGSRAGPFFDPLRKTALHGWHQARGARFEVVGQWHRPWYYPQPGEPMEHAVRRECRAVRGGVGILDASTLGKIDLQGRDTVTLLNRVYINEWRNLQVGGCRYGVMLNENGMVMDDGVTARLAEHHYLMSTTSAGAARVLAWLEFWLQREWSDLEVYLTSVSEHWATLSLAGPESRRVLAEVCRDCDLSSEAFPHMAWREGIVAGVTARIFRVSFSGELSFEVNVQANEARHVWDALIAAGESRAITAYGTQAMEILRTEKGYIIVGQDTDGAVTPLDLGMGRLIKRDGDFLGRRSLARPECTRADRRQLVGLVSQGPRTVLPEGAQLVEKPSVHTPIPMVGHVTSSCFSPALGRGIALALVKGGRQRSGQTLHAPLADGRVLAATVTDPVFYDREGARQRG
ncbi:MAG: sarcosine oxidase subunit alpha family protein [Gammaproteobacteria bacterium]